MSSKIQVQPERAWREVWHTNCEAKPPITCSPMRQGQGEMTLEDGAVLKLYECMGCGVKVFAGLDANYRVTVRDTPAEPIADRQEKGTLERIPIKDLAIEEPPTITVNGTKIKISPPCVLSYEDVLALEGFDPDRILSVVVKSPGKEGVCLAPGQKVEVTNGTWIEMADTSNA